MVDLSAPGPPMALEQLHEAVSAGALASFSRGLAVGFPGAVPEAVRVVPGRSPFEVWGAKGLVAEGRVLFVASGDQGLDAVRDVTPIEATVSVSVGNFFFSPSDVNINQGDKVHWTWVGGTHTPTSGDCPGGELPARRHLELGNQGGGQLRLHLQRRGQFSLFLLNPLVGHDRSSRSGERGANAPVRLGFANPVAGSVPLAVVFTGTAVGGTPPYTYAWSFGDGTADSSEKDPPHTYTQVGSYSAVLTVTDAASGTVQAAPVGITVAEPSSNPPVITAIKKVAPPFAIVITGSNLQNGIRVFINGAEWTSVAWKNLGKMKLGGGKALKAVVPKGASTLVRLLNPDGGSVTQTFTW